MTRTHAETAKLLSDGFNYTSTDWQNDRYEYINESRPAPGRQFVDAAVARMSAAVGGDDKVVHAIAGLGKNAEGDGVKFSTFALTDALVYHSAFEVVANGTVHVHAVPRKSLVSLTVTGASPFTQESNPARFKFTATYKSGLTLEFPLLGNMAENMSFMHQLYSDLKLDLSA